MRPGGGVTSFATASRTTLAKDSAISEMLSGWEGREGKLGQDLLNYSLSALFVGFKLLPIERPDLVFRSHVSVWCETTAEANHRVYDVMV